GPFHIDRYEVSNGDYLEFWNSLSEKEQADSGVRTRFYPRNWVDSSPPFPAGLANYPVLGVTQEGAASYARFRGKRLPTPYEWVLAAFGPDGDSTPPEWV